MGSEVSSGSKSLSFSSPPEFLPFPEPPASASWHDSVTSPVLQNHHTKAWELEGSAYQAEKSLGLRLGLHKDGPNLSISSGM